MITKTKPKQKQTKAKTQKPKTMTGGHAILESFVQEGVDTIFGYPGGAIMPVYDALYDYRDKVRHILVRHEQGATHAAEGYARIKGEPGVCMATSGPGATNLITGITDAMIDSVPMVCVTGQVHAESLGTDAFQEAAIVAMVTPVTKWVYQITRADEVAHVMKKAFHIARSGRPGPVLIDITKNAQLEMCEFEYPKTIAIPGRQIQIEPREDRIQEAALLLNNAKAPYVMVGHGVLISEAEEEVQRVVEAGNFPVASTLLGLGSMRKDHPNYVGMLGMHGNYATNKLVNEADVILAVGMRFDDRVTGKVSEFAKNAKIIHIDIDPAEYNKIMKTSVFIQADARAALTALLPHLKKEVYKDYREAWRKRFDELYETEHEKVIQQEIAPKEGPITMPEVIAKVSNMTKGEAVVVADVGQHQMAAARYYGFQPGSTFITSGGLGTMGFAVPAGIGAKIADEKNEVVVIVGDGCFQMNIQELGTIMQEGIAVKMIILNNEHLGMVRQWQEMFFDERYSEVAMKNPSFTTLADAYAIPNQTVYERKELDHALKTFFKAKGSYVLDIRVKKEEKVFPIVPAGASVEDIIIE